MKELKRTAFRMILCFEGVLVIFFYFCSRGGLQAVRTADEINKDLLEEIKQLEKEAASLALELEERLANPFYRESIARKELQMAYKDETVYLLPEA
jgi:cell division protein FtsB